MSKVKSPNVFGVCRSIFDDTDFAPEPFTQREAFLWLVANATWADFKVRGLRGPITLHRGEFCFSIRFLATKWKWSKSRVDRVISMLKNRDIIRDTSRDGEKVYFIKNYNYFQVTGIPKRDDYQDDLRDTSGTRAGQERDKEETGKTGKTLNKEKIETKVSTKKNSPEAILEILSEIFDADRSQAVFEYRRDSKKKIALTENSARLLVGKLKGCVDPAAAADEMILRGWTSVDQKWIDNGNASKTTAFTPKPTKTAATQRHEDALGMLEAINEGKPYVRPTDEQPDAHIIDITDFSRKAQG